MQLNQDIGFELIVTSVAASVTLFTYMERKSRGGVSMTNRNMRLVS